MSKAISAKKLDIACEAFWNFYNPGKKWSALNFTTRFEVRRAMLAALEAVL